MVCRHTSYQVGPIFGTCHRETCERPQMALQKLAKWVDGTVLLVGLELAEFLSLYIFLGPHVWSGTKCLLGRPSLCKVALSSRLHLPLVHEKRGKLESFDPWLYFINETLSVCFKWMERTLELYIIM